MPDPDPTGPSPTEERLARVAEDGFVILEGALPPSEVAAIRDELGRVLESNPFGRNDFEGFRTQRVYSAVAKGQALERLAIHPDVLALCDALLQPNHLLTASQAIVIAPGETAQAVHFDDTFYPLPRPRDAVSVSTMVAIDDFTIENGATEIVPGSHRWSDDEVSSWVSHLDMTTRAREERTPRAVEIDDSRRTKLVPVEMKSGSILFFLGTLLHRGGANRSERPRAAVSNQYCEPWARPQENFFLSVPREVAATLEPTTRRLLGYSIHPPFMGHANGRHPERFLDDEAIAVHGRKRS